MMMMMMHRSQQRHDLEENEDDDFSTGHCGQDDFAANHRLSAHCELASAAALNATNRQKARCVISYSKKASMHKQVLCRVAVVVSCVCVFFLRVSISSKINRMKTNSALNNQ